MANNVGPRLRQRYGNRRPKARRRSGDQSGLAHETKRIARRHLFPAGLKPGTRSAKFRLNVDHAELAIFDLAVRGHGPKKSDAVSRSGDVWVIAAGHQYGIALADYRHQIRLLSI